MFLCSNKIGVLTMPVDSLHCLQHVPPVELSFQGVDSLAIAKPRVEVQVATLHQHIDVAVCDLTKMNDRS